MFIYMFMCIYVCMWLPQFCSFMRSVTMGPILMKPVSKCWSKFEVVSSGFNYLKIIKINYLRKLKREFFFGPKAAFLIT